MTKKTTSDAETHFATEHLASNLKQLSIRGGAATFAGQGAKFALALGSTMILARLLTPQDFGLIAMVTAVTGFIMVFKDLGLSIATVQRAEINHRQISTLFWINMAVGVVLMLITIALAPAIAWFYKDPRLLAVTAALSIAFIFGGLTIQHQALLRRQMRLAAVATIDVVSMIAGISTAIICAWAGLGYWALVWMQVATAVANAAGVWISSGWRPGWPVRRSGVRSMLAFGGYMTCSSFVNYFARNLDNVLIGRYWGAQSLGTYAKSYSLLLLPIGQIVAPMTSVAVPALSRLKEDPDRYRGYYLKALCIIAYLTFPVVISLAVLSTEIVAIILGDQWLGAVPIFRILAITAMFQPVVSTVGWVYVSLGQTRRMAIWGIVTSIITIFSFVIGLPWGAMGVATSYSLCSVLLIYPEFYVAMGRSPVSSLDVLRVLYRPFFVSIFIGIGMLGIRQMLNYNSPLITILVSLICGTVFGVLSLLAWPMARQDLRDIFAEFAFFLCKHKI